METLEITEMLKDPKEFVGALYGTLLGDTSITKPVGGANSRLSFGQNNEAYANWKALVLMLAGFKKPRLYNRTWRSGTPRLPKYSKMYDFVYHKGRKTVTEHMMKSITPLGLALWYYDDGDFHKQKQEVKLATMCFNHAEHELMQRGLFKRFGLRFNIHKRKSAKGGNRKSYYFYFRMKQSDRELFFSLIEPFRCEPMTYKFPTAEGMDKIINNSRLCSGDVDELLPERMLFRLYYIDKKSMFQISHETGVNSGTILGRLRKLESRLADCVHQDIV